MSEPTSLTPSTPALPDLGNLLSVVEQEFESVQPVAYASKGALESYQELDPAAPYVRAAAVLHTFDAKSFRPLTSASDVPGTADAAQTDRRLLSLLACSTMVVSAQEETRWTLRDSVRRSALRELLAEKQVQQALAANPQMAFDPHDPVQRTLVAVLTGSLLPLDKLKLGELTALQRVTPWVEELPLPLPLPPHRKSAATGNARGCWSHFAI